MTSSGKRVNYGRRFFWFALAIVLAGALYTAGWFYAAERVVSEVNTAVSGLNREGRRASCENPEARGYPFRIGVFCRSVMYEDARRGVRFRARQLRSAAQVYQPFHIVGELDGPGALEAPGIAALDLAWSSLRTSVRLASPLPERVSVEAKELVVRLDEPGDVSPLLAEAETFELHMRPADDGHVDLATRFAGLRLDENLAGVASVPPLSGLVDASVSGEPGGLRGRSGVIRTANVSLGGDTGAAVAGPFSVDMDGLIDAELQVTLHNPRALAGVLGDLMPESRQELELGLSGLAAAGDAPTLPLRIDRGRVSLGFLSLGQIPPL